jgi:hypothetical protein
MRMVADPTRLSAEFRNALLAVLIVAVDSNRQQRGTIAAA